MQAMADATGSDPMALIYDALVAGKVLWAPLGRNPNQDMPLDMLSHPNVKVRLGTHSIVTLGKQLLNMTGSLVQSGWAGMQSDNRL
jgi:hypothetical protein